MRALSGSILRLLVIYTGKYEYVWQHLAGLVILDLKVMNEVKIFKKEKTTDNYNNQKGYELELNNSEISEIAVKQVCWSSG